MDGDEDDGRTLDYRRAGEADSNPNLTPLEEKLRKIDVMLVVAAVVFVLFVLMVATLLIYA